MRHWIPLAFALVGTAACTDTPSETMPGTLEVTLSSPHTDDGGALITVRGGAITRIEPARQEYEIHYERQLGSEWRILILGPIVSGPLVTLDIPDADRASRYAATLEEIASDTSYAQYDVSDYRVTVAPHATR